MMNTTNANPFPDLASLARRLPERPLTRFAPSPTGFLHLGHVVNMMYTWGVTRALNGRILLRSEDHDRGRFRPEYEQDILENLDWLGFEHDLGGFTPDEPSEFRQSDCDEHYRGALEHLRRQNLVYACSCSRKDIAALSPDTPANEEPRYGNTCREKALPWATTVTLRCRIPDRPTTFEDGRLGLLEQTPAARYGDPLIRDRHGNWTYQFAVVVDDKRHGVDLIVRGEDILPSTGRQILLHEALGNSKTLVFVHHPLLRDADGRKLGKRIFSESIASRRRAGDQPQNILGEAAAMAGLIPTSRPLRVKELADLFRSQGA
jgi:glutamyl-tRNA synthetase/glutamyl-Q tRNA(Asp) synthetase